MATPFRCRVSLPLSLNKSDNEKTSLIPSLIPHTLRRRLVRAQKLFSPSKPDDSQQITHPHHGLKPLTTYHSLHKTTLLRSRGGQMKGKKFLSRESFLRNHQHQLLRPSNIDNMKSISSRITPRRVKWADQEYNIHKEKTVKMFEKSKQHLQQLEARYGHGYMKSNMKKNIKSKKNIQSQEVIENTNINMEKNTHILSQITIPFKNIIKHRDNITNPYNNIKVDERIHEITNEIIKNTKQAKLLGKKIILPSSRVSYRTRISTLPIMIKQFNQFANIFTQQYAHINTKSNNKPISYVLKSSGNKINKPLKKTFSKLTPKTSSSTIHTTSKRNYRRRYYVDPAESHSYAGIKQGLGYATRTEDSYKPGSTHIVSALNVFEHDEYREPTMLRYRWIPIRAFRRLTDRPFKMYLWALLPIPIVYFYILTFTAWDMATKTRTVAKEYMSQAGLAMQLRQLRVMIEQDLIDFQNEEAKHAFIGVLNGVEEDVRLEFSDNGRLRQLENIVRTSFIQPLNEMIKPKRQKIFFEYANLQLYNRAVDNIHNRRAVNLTEQSLYRISNQHRRKYQLKKLSSGVHAGRMDRQTWMKYRARRLPSQAPTSERYPYEIGNYVAKYGPLLRSFENLPGYFWWGALVALADAFWLRDTRHPLLGSIHGNLFTIRPVHNDVMEKVELFNNFLSPTWRRFKTTLASFDTHWFDGKLFLQDRTFQKYSNSRIRDADSLLREMERYVVQGEYVKLPKERIDDPHDPLLRGIPPYILNNSDKTISGPLYNWYSKKLMEKDPDSWAMYRRFLIAELMLLKQVHNWLRSAAYIQLGQQVPPANVQGYLKFYDESYLPFPDHKYAQGDMDTSAEDAGMWDEIIQYAYHVEDTLNSQALQTWLELGKTKETFQPATKITESVYAIMPLRGNYTSHSAKDVDFFKKYRHDPWGTHYYQGLKNRGEMTGDWKDPKQKLAMEAWQTAGDHSSELSDDYRLRTKAEAEGKVSKTQSGRWSDLVLRQIQQDYKRGLHRKRPDSVHAEDDSYVDRDFGQTPLARSVPEHEFTPYNNELPWPEGFFKDDPAIDDPYYYTRKFGLGTRKDWDRMVRLGAWPDIEHIEDTVTTTTGHLPQIWDPDGLHGHNMPVFLHERTHQRLTKKLKKERMKNGGKGEWDSTELLWLNVVYNKLARSRRYYSFTLFPSPHERLLAAKHNNGSSFYFDTEADQDLFTSNQYNDDWILFSQMPSIYPIAPPLHEMNFVTTLISRIEGCIMQHAAELDLSTLKIKELAIENAEYETRGLLVPTVSPEIEYDDEMQAILNHRPHQGVMINRVQQSNNIQDKARFGSFDENARRLRYSELYDPYAWLGEGYTTRQRLVSNLREIVDNTLDTLTGRGILWDTDEYKNKKLLKLRIRQSFGHTGIRVRDVLDNNPKLKFIFSQRTNTFQPAYYVKMHSNGDINRVGVPNGYLQTLTNSDWVKQHRDEAVMDRILNYTYNEKLKRLRHDSAAYQYLLDDFSLFQRGRQGRHAYVYRDKKGNERRMYNRRWQVTVNPLIHGKRALMNKYRAARRQDPFDRTKTWEMYYHTDARPNKIGRDRHTGDPLFQRRFASRILGETKHDQILDPTGYHKLPSYEEKPLMKARKDQFLRQYGGIRGGEDDFHTRKLNVPKDQYERVYNDRGEFERLRTEHIKQQVESTITMDTLPQYQRMRNLLDKFNGGPEPSATYDMFNPDYYVAHGGLPDPRNPAEVALFQQEPHRHAGYNQLGRLHYFPQ